MEKPILVTGGSGFIGSNFILQWLAQEGSPVVNLDKLTVAGQPSQPDRGFFDPAICFRARRCLRPRGHSRIAERHQPRPIVHFAAESHVDRSILGPDDFIRTNVFGTFCLLEETRLYYGESIRPGNAIRSASCKSRPMKCTDRLLPAIRRFARPRPTLRTVRIRRRRRVRTIWCAPTITPTACPR